MWHKLLKTTSASLIVFSLALVQPVLQSQTPTLDSEQWAMLALINNFRTQNGVAPLQVSVNLQKASQWMATDMAKYSSFSYRDSMRRAPGARLFDFGYNYAWAEDIAEIVPNAQSVFDQWLTTCVVNFTGACSYTHQNFMLDRNFVVVGIGRAYNLNSSSKWYWCLDMGTFKDQTISPNAAPPPVITSFSANPSTINSGGSTTLACPPFDVSPSATKQD